MRIERVVVVGAGLAGLRTVEELRRRGYQGTLTMVGAEPHPPYDRPPLTKKFMLGQQAGTFLEADLGALGVRARLGEPAAGLEPAEGVVRTRREEHRFDAAVLATGATPVRLPGTGVQRVLRTLDDARSLRAALRPGVRLAIVGAGWIGAELATAAATLGCRVTVVEAGPAPLPGALPAEVGVRTVPWYEAAGVELILGRAVESVEHGGLALAGGGWLPADEIVTAIGVKPAVGWLAGSGIAVEGGVAVDEHLRASAPGVYACGDCAAFRSLRYRARLRVEHWDGALHAPEAVAANVLGGNEIYDPVPYFWSEQFGRMVQYVGQHLPGDRLIWRGDPAGPTWAVCWLARGTGAAGPGARDGLPPGPGAEADRVEPAGSVAGAGRRSGSPVAGRLAAALAVGRPRDLTQARRLIASGTAVDPVRLSDPGVPVRDALA